MGIYSKNLSGQNQMVFVGPTDVEYTTDSTYAEFIDNAVEGELGVFLEAGTTRTTALTAGLRFFVAQKRDGSVRKTNVMVFGDSLTLSRTDYAAATRQISHIGYNGTSGDLGFNFTTASSTNTLTYGIAVRETTPGNQPFPIQEGYATVNSTTADEYTVVAQIVSTLNGDYDYQRAQPDRFVKAEVVSNGTLTELTEDATLINGSRTVTFAGVQTIAAGVKLSFRGAIYNVTTGVVAGTSLIIDRPYQGASETIDVSATADLAATMAYTSGTNLLGVRFTGLYDETTFKIAGTGNLYQDTVTNGTPWVLGSGSGASVRELEATEGAIFDGVGSTLNAEFKADYGQPTLFSSLAETYDVFFLAFANKILPSAVPTQFEQKQIERLIIAVPAGGTTPTSELDTIFGL